MYSREYMACHTLGGKSSKESDKDGLPPDHISTLIGDYDVLLTSNYHYINYPSPKKSNRQFTSNCISSLFNECFYRPSNWLYVCRNSVIRSNSSYDNNKSRLSVCHTGRSFKKL